MHAPPKVGYITYKRHGIDTGITWMPENEGPSTYLNANEEPFDTEAEWKGLGYVKEAQEVRQERQRLRPEESGQQGACHRAFWRHGDSRNAAAGLRGREPERVSAF